MNRFDNINECYESYFTFDEPIAFKDRLLLYPVLMKDYFTFLLALPILKIDKNSIANEDIIRMSYLEFVIRIINDNKKEDEKTSAYELMLAAILELCFHYNGKMMYGIDSRGKSYLKIGTTYLNSKDFDKMKDLILAQNFPGYKDNYINPELEKELAEADRIRNGDIKPCSIEKHIMAVVISSSMTLKEVYELSVRKFKIALEMIDKKMHYVMMRNASMSGMVKFKEDIKHYLVEDTKNDIENKIMDYDTLENKVNSVN